MLILGNFAKFCKISRIEIRNHLNFMIKKMATFFDKILSFPLATNNEIMAFRLFYVFDKHNFG